MPLPSPVPAQAETTTANYFHTYRSDVDGLRAIAVLSVLGFHAFPELIRGGFVGVDIFFVISGFLISGKLFEDHDQRNFTYADFYGRRVRRLFPSLLLVLACCLLAGWFLLLSSEYESLGKHSVAGLAFVANLALWRESSDYFSADLARLPLLHLWSLGIEEQFYIVWPPLLMLIWRLGRQFLPVATLLALLSFGACELALSHGNAIGAFYLPWSRFWELFGGSLLAYLTRYRAGWQSRWPSYSQNLGLLLLLGAVLGLSESIPFPGWAALLPVVGAFVVLAAPVNRQFAGRLLSSEFMVAVGMISYPLYLWHWPLLAFLRILMGETPAVLWRVLVLLVSGVLAWLTYKYVESPLRFHKRRRAVTSSLCLVALALGAWGGVLWHTDWVQGRPLDQRFADFDKRSYKTRFSDGSCEHLLGLPTMPEEVCLSNSREPEFLFLGNSHGMAINSAAELNLVGMKTMFVGAHGCLLYPTLRQTLRMPQNFGHHCEEIAEKAVRVALNTPSVKTIVIAESMALVPAELGQNSFVYHDASGRALSEQEAFVVGNDALISRLRAAGKRIVFFEDTPGLQKDPQDCVQRFGVSGTAACRVPVDTVRQWQAPYHAALQALGQRWPDLLFYHSTEALCDQAFCYANQGNQFYYLDHHHLSPSGSALVLHDFLRQFPATR